MQTLKKDHLLLIRVSIRPPKMSSQDINGLNNPLVFQDETLRFNCGPPQRRVGNSDTKTRELSGFMDEKLFAVDRDRFFTSPGTDFRRNVFGEGPDRSESRNWNGNGSNSTPRGKGSEEDEEDEDEDEEEDDDDDEDEVDDEGEGDVERLVAVDEQNKSSHDGNNHNGGSVQSGGANKIGNGKAKHRSSFGGIVMVGSNREVLLKEGMVGLSGNHTRTSPSSGPTESNQQRRLGGSFSNAVTIAENDGDVYYSQYLRNNEGSACGQKELVVENGCGFSGRRDVSYSCESGESLRAILSDPVTGALMDDAVILPCGHSFGSGGIQHVLRTKACFTCYQSISGDSIALNLSLRAAVQAFRREEELQFYRSPKRRKERFDQDKGGFGDSTLMDARGRGVQFPFAVTDRVIIKGNKRTPQRFVGREAVVTTQCLNGWYVVKTVDNAESVKLQYRSLSKVPNDPSSKPMSKMTAPNWL